MSGAGILIRKPCRKSQKRRRHILSDLEREEYNLPLNKESYEHLIAKADGKIIKKKRYLIPYEKYTIELDIFEGELAPLVIAEVEFETVEEANSFTPPSWFGEDVTGNKNYTNASLALN